MGNLGLPFARLFEAVDVASEAYGGFDSDATLCPEMCSWF